MLLLSIFIIGLLSSVKAQYHNNFGSCITANGQNSACVHLEECDELYNVIQRQPLSEDDKFYLIKSRCGTHRGKLLVCCPPNSGGNSPSPSNTYSNPGSSVSNTPGTLPQPGVCGSGPSDKIFGGNVTRIDEYPWMALLEYTKPGNAKGHHCGGSLINERYVVTASHCVNGKGIPTQWRLTGVRLGEWDRSTTVDCDDGDCAPPHQDVPIEQTIPHEQYDPNSIAQSNDIALLRLARRVEFSGFIKPICLPEANHLRSATFDGVPLVVAGWGQTETGRSSSVKLKARIDGFPLPQCQEIYRPLTIDDKQICAGGEEFIDSCKGDSGGPLIGFDDNKSLPYFFLVGLVSFGPSDCGTKGKPGVYTRTSAYLDWIKHHIKA